MPTYLATGRGSVAVMSRGAQVRYEFTPGEPVEVAREHIGELVRAGAPVDWDRLLSDAEAKAAKAKREAREAEKAAREAEGRRVLRQWVEAWDGPRCPGSPGATVYHGDRPHTVEADPLDTTGRTGLHARWREQADHIDGGWWIVACWWHTPAWERHDTPPPLPPATDRQVRRYQVTRDFSCVIGTPYDLARNPATRQIITDGDGRVRWSAGDVVPLPGWLAAQVERDCPGTLQLLGADGLLIAQPAPSTEDTKTEDAKPRKTVRAKG